MTKILIVDDNDEDRYLLQVLLEGHGYEVTTATNGLEALEVAQRDPPDMIISDILMPGMDGFSLCRQWRQDARLQAIPFVFYTATYTDPQDQAFALSLGADRFIVKPEELDVFVQILLEVIAERQAGRLDVQRTAVEEPVYLRQYNAILIHKLEKKLIELEEAKQALERAMAEQQHLEQQLRQQAEAALRDSEARQHAILQTAVDGIITIDARGRVESLNPAAERLFDYPADEVIGQNVSMLMPSPYREAHDGYLARYLQTGEAHIIGIGREVRGQRRDGMTFPVALAVSEVLLDSHRLFTGIVHDLSARVQAEEALRQAHDELEQRVQERTAALHALLDINKHIGQTSALAPVLNTIAREAAHLLDVPVALVRQREGDDLVLASFWGDAVEMTLRPRLKIGEHLSGLVAASRQPVIVDDVSHNDRITPESRAFRLRYGLLAYLGVPLIAGDEILGILSFHGRTGHHFAPTDVEMATAFADQAAIAIQRAQLYTRLQQAYDDLQQTQQIVVQQERLRALGQMASGIAHDINNALLPVTLYVEALLTGDPTLSSRAREYLTTVQQATHDVAHTIARLGEFYRQPAGLQEALPVDLNQIVSHVLELTRARWRDQPQQRGLTITVHTVFEEELPRVRGVASELREALVNLVFNAIDAMPQGGTLTLQTWATPTAVLLEVSDTGIGMDEVTRQRCLEPFYTTKGERGTGLGLAIVYGILERHAAQLVIESAVGQGTTMRLIFPRAPGDDEQPAQPVEVKERAASLRILVIDDESLVRAALRDVLQSDGHVVTVAEGGVAGLAAFHLAQTQHEPFTVVITDLGMPGMDGREVARVVKQTSPETPVILLTGWGETLQREGNLPPHVDHLLSKPPKLSDVQAALVTVTASWSGRTGQGHI